MSDPEKSLLDKVRETAFKHALINAVKHEGKADLKAVVSKVVGELPEIRRNVKDYMDVIRGIIEEVNKLSPEEQMRLVMENWPELLEAKKEKEKRLPPLPGAVEGKVTTRFAPNPDYTIHLGNARPALLSYWYAEQYDGEMILRFEDTDPRVKAPYPEAYNKIKEDLRWLGVKWSREYIQSLRLGIFYDIARELISKGGAYVDKCSDKEFKSYRNSGRACPHRDLPPDKHLEEFDKMLEGHYGEGEAVVRVKTDLSHPDPSVREWVAFRIIDTTKTPHPVVGEKYIVWPTYNFAAGVDDHLMGVTHVLRAKEHISNTVKQKYLYDHLGWKYPEAIHFGRLSLEGFILSKSKMRKMIVEYGIEAYSDPRLGTLNGLRRRGFLRETLWRVIQDVGVKPVDARISFVNLSSINRALVDPIANRYMAVEDPVPLKLMGLPGEVVAKVPVHPSRPETFNYKLADGDIVYISRKDAMSLRGRPVRLMGIGNFVLGEPLIDESGIALAASYSSASMEEAKKLGAQIIQWVYLRSSINVELLVPSGVKLIAKALLAEERLRNEKEDSVIQFYRIGFARVDEIGDVVKCVFAHE